MKFGTILTTGLVASVMTFSTVAVAQDQEMVKTTATAESKPEIRIFAGAGVAVSKLTNKDDDSKHTSVGSPVYGALAQFKAYETPVGSVLAGIGAQGATANQDMGTFKADGSSVTLNSLQINFETGLAQNLGGFEIQETVGYHRGVWHEYRTNTALAVDADSEWQAQDVSGDNAVSLAVRALRDVGPVKAGFELGGQARRFKIEGGDTENLVSSSAKLLIGYQF